ncbi:MAG: type IV pilin [Thermoplasmata archaeon]|nr:type IV pilin [Thermoplasmata archaeon]
MSPIVATILLVAMTVVLAAVLYVLVSGLTNGTAPKTPISTALALGTPISVNRSGGNWNNFSVAAAGHGLQWGNLEFQLFASNGAAVALPSGSTISVLSITGGVIGSYAYGSASWSLGSSLAVNSQHTLSIYSAAVALHGDRLVVYGVGSFQGSVGMILP